MTQELTIAPRSVTVQIPNELTNYVLQETEVCGRYLVKRTKGNSSHRLAKFYGFYLLLKAEAPGSGWILNYTKQIPELSRNFGISQRTFFNYLSGLEKLKIAFREGNKIRLVGWDQLGRLLDIDTRQKTKIQFTYDGKQKIHWWFTALEIKDSQERQAYMIWKKVNKNPEAKNELLTAMYKRGFDKTKLNNPEYFSGRLFALYVEDFRTGTEVHDILIRIRSDVNRSVKRLAYDWCISPQLTSYWKKKMHQQQIIGVAKIWVESKWSKETSECHKNQFCHVIWNDRKKERVWFLCDQINVIMPWKWAEFLEKLKVA